MKTEKLLNGVGIKVFIEYYQYFNDNNLSVNDIIEILPSMYTEKSRKSRISKARTIIKENKLQEVIKYILESTRIDSKIKDEAKKLLNAENSKIIYPDEIGELHFFEGAKKQIIVNAYERNILARQECINRFGYKCFVCDFDFEKIYGEIGKDFIHVHHIKPLSEIDEQYKVDAIQDLRPVCPNCHAMLHKRKPAFSIEDIKNKIIINTIK